MLDRFLIEDILKNALREDISYVDITSEYLIDGDLKGEAVIIAKERGVVCGIDVASLVFSIVDDSIEFIKIKKDTDVVNKGELIANVRGSLKSILKAERVALNFIQRMSGIASKSRELIDLVKDLDVKIVDTRKTTPGLRIFEKYAVVSGGAFNHRFNLSDTVMIKDNHIKAIGSITEAIKRVKSRVPHTTKIEIEVENLKQLRKALDAKADIILLDNMNIKDMREAVEITNNKAILEASGNINSKNLRKVAETGVDIISVGGLTHSFKSMDISLNIK